MSDVIDITMPVTAAGNDPADNYKNPKWIAETKRRLNNASQGTDGEKRRYLHTSVEPTNDYAMNGTFVPDGEPEPLPVFEFPDAISDDEWSNSVAAPPCIVESLLYQDVSLLSAGGGTGKTTLTIYEAIHIILDRTLYGRKINRPGSVMIITAEDSRTTMIARARKICIDMGLTDDEIESVKSGLLIKDASSEIFRLTKVERDVIEISLNTDLLISAIKGKGITLLILDPLVSFGTGEGRVNDSEQGLIMAARRIIRLTGVGVQFVHHVSQASSREKHVDAYAARGGTALPDGCRTVRILHNADNDDRAIPQSLSGDQILKMHIPKTTYAKPQGHIWLSRQGYSFDWSLPDPERGPEEIALGQQSQILNFITHQLKSERPARYSRATLGSQNKILNMTRADIRAGVDALLACRKLINAELPPEEKQGRKQCYLSPIQPIKPNSAKGNGRIVGNGEIT